MPMKKPSKHIYKAAIALCIFLVGYDFANFGKRAENFANAKVVASNYDAVVVLTGGRNRIARASEIAQLYSLPLFISGVHKDATSDEVAIAAGVDPVFFNCCVTLGYNALTTHGNGVEIANWAKEETIDSLIVVTSNYHMERALLELKRSMPLVELAGQSVDSPVIDAGAWWTTPTSAKRMLVEWIKWRVVKLRDMIT